MFKIEVIPSQFKCKIPILALGSDTRFRISWTQDGDIFSLSTKAEFADPSDFYLRAVEFLLKTHRLPPRFIAFDPHPFFDCNKAARLIQKKYFPKAELKPVFHHIAHAANFGIECGLKQKFIGVTFDGTGFGQDRNIWGGEFFVYPARDKASKMPDGCLRQPVSNGVNDQSYFKRVAHLNYQPMPGNEAAIRQPWRMAFSFLYRIYGPKIFKMKFKFLDSIEKEELSLVAQILEKRFNAPLTSSAGRLFDAVSALLNLKTIVTKEAEAAIALEKAAAQFQGSSTGYPCQVKEEDGLLIVDTPGMFRRMTEDVLRKKDIREIAYRFHLTLALAVGRVCNILKKRYFVRDVYLSGGVFMNRLLSDEIQKILVKNGFRVLFAKKATTGDAGISQGQIAAIVMEK